MTIRDDASNDHLTVSTMMKCEVFQDVVDELVTNGIQPEKEDYDFIVSPVRRPKDNVWRFTSKNNDGSVILNHENLDKIHRTGIIIMHEVRRRSYMCNKYPDAIEMVRAGFKAALYDYPQMCEGERMYEIYANIHHADGAEEEDLWYQVVSLIITARSELLDVPLYAEFYNKMRL